uniref:FBA_2 domain-containing protein n=1 Tax=Caenorhabditis tropicalis TaxID=1561998 RepID=A0A1I7US68_9PELO
MSLSKRSKNLVKLLVKKYRIASKIWIIRNDLQMLVGRPEEMHPQYLQANAILPLGDNLPICNNDLAPDALQVVHLLQLNALYTWTNLLKEVFKIDICGVTLFFAEEKLIDRILKLLRNFDMKTSIELIATGNCVATSRKILAHCSTAFDFSIVSGMPERNFAFNRFNSYGMNELTIYYSQWVTVQNLISLRNCVRVKLLLSFFKPEEVNNFLKQWVKDSRIEYLHMPYISEGNVNDENIIFRGLRIYSNGDLINGK